MILALKTAGEDTEMTLVMASGTMRIGHSVANALADGLGIPVVGTRGDDWLAEGLGLVKTAKPGRSTLPHYGSEAHITRPKS
jgi:hypothetical protein